MSLIVLKKRKLTMMGVDMIVSIAVNVISWFEQTAIDPV